MAIDYRAVQQRRLVAVGKVTDKYSLELKRVSDRLQLKMSAMLGKIEGGGAANIGSLGDVALARAQAQKLLVESGYYQVTGDLLSSGYQQLLNNSLDIYSEFYDKALQFSDVSNSRLNAISQMQSQVFQDIGDKYATDLQRIMTNLNFGTSSIEASAKALADTLDDGLKRYAETIVRTQVHAFERESASLMATEAGIDEFIYVGPDDDVTRKFCQTYLEEGNNIKKWEEWSKIINPDDPMGPITIYGGGHSCRHELVPYVKE